MFCNKCGSPVNEGEAFCTACGEKIEAVQPAQYASQPVYQQQQPPVQQPYGQPAMQQPYGQQPYGQPPKKSSKALLWVIIGVVAALAIAAVLIFVVFPAGGTGGNWPFAGNTTQTRFVNDSFKVFSESFSGIGGGDTFERMGKEPFDMTVDMTASAGGQQSTATVDVAYDNESLGMRFGQDTSANIILLLGDTLYTEFYGTTSGVRFDTDADLSKPMSLEDRVKALTEGLTKQNAAAKMPDYGKLVEMLVNSIDEKCFEKSGDKTTLTLNIDDVINMLNTFSEKLENDKQLLEDLDDYIKQVSGAPVDFKSALSMAVSLLEAQKGSIDFELVWEVSYKNGTPAGLEITLDNGSSKYIVTYGYEKQGAKTSIDFSVNAAGTEVATGEFSFEKTAEGINYDGSITASGQTVTLNGLAKSSGENASGELTINVPGAGEAVLKYDETLKFGAPSGKVAEDSRFKVDTQNATVTDMSGLMNPYGLTPSLPGASILPSDFETQVEILPSDGESGSSELDGTLWECEGYQDGDMYVEGQTLYFENGKVYFGQAGMNGQEIIDSGLDAYGGVDYTFDGYTISLTAPDGTKADYYYDGSSIWAGTTIFTKVG